MRRLVLPAVLVLALAGCKSVTKEDRQVVAAYLENAAQYYENAHYLRAYQQWGRALELDPDEERAQLGQAMALYQIGRTGDARENVEALADAERRLDVLRRGGLGDQSWKAEIGYGLAQQRWAELFEKAQRVHEAQRAAGKPVDEAKSKEAARELPRRIAAAESSYQAVLTDPRTEPSFKVSVWVGLARLAAMRGDHEASLAWCRVFEGELVRAREFWAKQGDAFESRVFGVKLQEAELRDVLGNTLFKLGRFEEAEKELDRLVALQPARANAYLNRGMLREARGAWDLARSDYGTFLARTDLPPDDPAVVEAEKRRLLCEDRLAAEDARVDRELPVPR